MVELIKKKKLENLILNIIIIAISITTIVLISDNYKQIFMEENNINSLDTFNKLIKEKTYVNIDLTNAELTRFSLENKKTENIDSNVYTVTYEDDIVVLFLKPNSALTDLTKGKLVEPVKEELEIINQLQSENKNKTVRKICFSNINYPAYESFYRYLFTLLIVSIILSIIFSVFDVIYYMNPKKTHSYIKYLKNR